MRACPACGLELPAHARFCARCGASLPAARSRTGGFPPWVLVLLAVGALVSGLAALVYGSVLLASDLPAAAGVDPGRARASAVLLAAAATAMCGLQVAALAGLMRDREWGRVTATLACVGWALTCAGLPLSLLVLNALWGGGRRRRHRD